MKKSGFTLLETMIVVAILAILIASVSPNVVAFLQVGTKAKENAAAETVYNAFQTFAANKQISLLQGWDSMSKDLALDVDPSSSEVYRYIQDVVRDAVGVQITSAGTQPTEDNYAVIQVKGKEQKTVITVLYGRFGQYEVTFDDL